MEVTKKIIYNVELEEDDVCVDCKGRFGCPLIETLSQGIVEFSEDVTSLHVEDCVRFEQE